MATTKLEHIPFIWHGIPYYFTGRIYGGYLGSYEQPPESPEIELDQEGEGIFEARSGRDVTDEMMELPNDEYWKLEDIIMTAAGDMTFEEDYDPDEDFEYKVK